MHATNNEDVTHESHRRIDGQHYYYTKTKWELDGKVAINVRNSRRHEDAKSSMQPYKHAIRHVLMNGSETWVLRNAAMKK